MFSGSQIGGGFVSGQNDSYNQSSNVAAKRVIPYDERKLSQVTIKQIKTAPPAHGDDPVMIDDSEVSQMHMIVRVMSMDVQSSHTDYKINDYTGNLDAKQWSNDDQPTQQNQIAEGTWVHIYGKINNFQGRCSVNVFEIEPVTNFDEVTHHFTEVIFAHLSNLEMAKKREMTQQSGGMMMDQGSMNTMNNGNASGPGYGNQQNNQGMSNQGMGQGMDNNNNGGWNNNQGMDSGRDPLQQAVLNVVKHPQHANSETGCHVDRIFEKLQPQYDRQTILDSINTLSEEGAMYSTLDEEHFKAVE